jgi:hypothetical protein
MEHLTPAQVVMVAGGVLAIVGVFQCMIDRMPVIGKARDSGIPLFVVNKAFIWGVLIMALGMFLYSR